MSNEPELYDVGYNYPKSDLKNLSKFKFQQQVNPIHQSVCYELRLKSNFYNLQILTAANYTWTLTYHGDTVKGTPERKLVMNECKRVLVFHDYS